MNWIVVFGASSGAGAELAPDIILPDGEEHCVDWAMLGDAVAQYSIGETASLGLLLAEVYRQYCMHHSRRVLQSASPSIALEAARLEAVPSCEMRLDSDGRGARVLIPLGLRLDDWLPGEELVAAHLADPLQQEVRVLLAMSLADGALTVRPQLVLAEPYRSHFATLTLPGWTGESNVASLLAAIDSRLRAILPTFKDSRPRREALLAALRADAELGPAILEWDSLCYRYAMIAVVRGPAFVVHLELPPSFPVDAPRLTLISLGGSVRAGPVEVHSPNALKAMHSLSPLQAVAAIKAHLSEVLGGMAGRLGVS